ncbi:MAG TPA: site-specific DNA-methyltransferase [Candidatus Acidoferrales bacterium]|nr:site-specific DNA-methyltransferase [Candidatus Acidoferrales bacterium]
MAKNPLKQKVKKKIETLTHEKASRKNIPTAEYQSVMRTEQQSPIRVAYERRNRDLDPQLVWRGKDEQDWSDLVVPAPPLFIQEKVHPKVLIDDLRRRSEVSTKATEAQIDLFANFNGLPSEAAKTEFYQHDAHWANRMILGDSLQVMASLAEREGLRGRVQCIYLDPPYGIKFNSNFQWSTTSRDVKDGNVEHITREPEQVKAFRDTWRDGIHSYLTYLRDRLTVARDLLTDSGSIFMQIGDENVHRVREILEEVFGESNFISQISFKKTGYQSSNYLPNNFDLILWFAKNYENLKFRRPFINKLESSAFVGQDVWFDDREGRRRRLSKQEKDDLASLSPENIFRHKPPESAGASARNESIEINGRVFRPKEGKHFSTTAVGMQRVKSADRFIVLGNSLRYIEHLSGFSVTPITNLWPDTVVSGFSDPQVYVVQTSDKVVERCLIMATDPGDLVLDPTCGSGTTATVAERWGRRWITIDTSRVALALARARIMGARYAYYLLADSRDGQIKEAEVVKKAPSETPTHNDVRQGFVFERVPHITLKSIANNAEIDVIWDEYQTVLEPLRRQLNETLKMKWEEWEIPRDADEKWPEKVKDLHLEWWTQRIARQKAIDASIAAKAEFEYLYDKPYEDNRRVRVAGPFTVESVSPHRVLSVDENDELIHPPSNSDGGSTDETDFVEMILENLKTAGVQQAHKDDKIAFTSIAPWPGYFVCAEGKYIEGDAKSGAEKRAAIFIGPEFGTVSRPDLVAAAREAGDAGFDVLITCAFNYDAHSSEFNKLGRIPVLKAHMNADLHMADDLKNTGKGNLFVIFGEPDIDIIKAKSDQIQVKINGVDVFHPNTGEVRSDGAEGIACWFIDTDYNEESFFVRQAYFLGANDPYKSLKTTLKAEINEEAWATLHSDTSRPFEKPKSGRIAVKVINHLGDEVMKVFKV